jgi:alanine-synthesizing transaminase
MFSSRVPDDLRANPLALAVRRAAAEGRTLIDLTLANPTRAGIAYPEGQLRALADARSSAYDPQPFGLREAREAVSADYARRGVRIPWEHIALTASTSEAYSLLFKLLCAPAGDAVLAPVPSYPLFDHLTRLDGVSAHAYRLDYGGRWGVDFDSVDQAWTATTRGVLAVSPNNPTGSVLSAAELVELDSRCAGRDAAVILDEVFADYPLGGPLPDAGVRRTALTCRLGGLSKSAALPQVKLGWVAVEGPPGLAAAALERLEVICDTYLSVSTPVQVAAADLIALGAQARQQVSDRVRSNYARLRQLASAHPAVDVLHADAGWSAVLRVPARGPEEDLVVDLVERRSVVVHPGFFFDFPHEAFLVVSLLPPPETFAEGIGRILEHVDG